MDSTCRSYASESREQWKNYRATEQLLAKEYFNFVTAEGPYRDQDEGEAFYPVEKCKLEWKSVVENEDGPSTSHHVQNVNIDDKRFHCDECEYKTKWKKLFQEHKRKHSNDLFQCSVCSFQTHSKYNLAMHKRTTHDTLLPEDLFSCDLCNFRTKHKSSLQYHEKKHTNEFFNALYVILKPARKVILPNINDMNMKIIQIFSSRVMNVSIRLNLSNLFNTTKENIRMIFSIAPSVTLSVVSRIISQDIDEINTHPNILCS